MLPDLSPITLSFAALVLFCAYFVRGVAGFGSGLVAIPLLALVYPLTLVVPVVVLLDFIGSASQGFKNRSQIAWRSLLPLAPFTIGGILLALLLLDSLDANTLRLCLGAFIIIYAVYHFLPLPTIQATQLASLPYGVVGGLSGTMFGIGGPFYVIYLNMVGLQGSTFRASFAMWFVLDGSIRLMGYAAFGFLDKESLTAFLVALPFAALGLFLGGRLHTNLSAEQFRGCVHVLLLMSGSALVVG